MGYLGAVGPAYDPTRATVPQLDAERFSGNNSAVAFTLLRQVVSPTDVDVFVENIRQEPIVAYSIVSGNILTFTEAPQTGTNNIYVIYRGSGTSNYAFVPDGSISYAKLANNIRQFNVDNFTANGSGTTFTLSETPATANTVIAAIDGVVQTAPSNYNISGSTIIFTSAPAASANVTVRHLGFRTTATVTALSAASVTATELADGAVTNAKLAGSITSDKLVSVNAALLVANTVANASFQTGSVENYLRSQTLDFGMRNRIINGAMVISQRYGASAIADGSAAGYTLDRWTSIASLNGKFSIQQDSSANTAAGFTSSLKVISSSAYSVSTGQAFVLQQAIEGYNVADLGWGTANAKPITLSFRARSSLTGTFGGVITNSALNRSYPFTYTISTADTWEYETITIPGDTTGTWLTTNGIGLSVFFGLGVGSSLSGTAGAWAGATYYSATGATSVVGTNGATFYITGIQLEEGSTPTSFEYRQYTTELQLCLRYYHFLGGDTPYQSINNVAWYADSAAVGFFRHPVPMRDAPSISKSGNWIVLGGGGTVGQTLSVDQNGPKTVQLGFGVGSGGTSGQASTLRVDNDNNFRLTFSAEL
jgi:hypothetical protein